MNETTPTAPAVICIKCGKPTNVAIYGNFVDQVGPVCLACHLNPPTVSDAMILTQLCQQVAELTQERDQLKLSLDKEVESSTLAIEILDGHALPIDYSDQSQPELLRKLCEHLEHFESLKFSDQEEMEQLKAELLNSEAVVSALRFELTAVTAERDQAKRDHAATDALLCAEQDESDWLRGVNARICDELAERKPNER